MPDDWRLVALLLESSLMGQLMEDEVSLDEGRESRNRMQEKKRMQVMDMHATAVHFQETCCLTDFPIRDSKEFGPKPEFMSGRMIFDPTVRDVVIPGLMMRVDAGIMVELSGV